MLCKAGCAGGDEADQEEHQKIHLLAQIEDGRQANSISVLIVPALKAQSC